MSTTKTNAGRPTFIGKRYPWDKWLKLHKNGKGTKYVLVKGTDFGTTTKTMTIYLYQVAKKHGVKLRIKELEEGRLEIQAHNGK